MVGSHPGDQAVMQALGYCLWEKGTAFAYGVGKSAMLRADWNASTADAFEGTVTI